MFDPSWLRKDLPEWPLRYRHNFARFTDYHSSRTGRSLVQGQNVLFIRQVALLNLFAGDKAPILFRKRFEQLYLICVFPLARTNSDLRSGQIKSSLFVYLRQEISTF
jgi:hypothetical protein